MGMSVCLSLSLAKQMNCIIGDWIFIRGRRAIGGWLVRRAKALAVFDYSACMHNPRRVNFYLKRGEWLLKAWQWAWMAQIVAQDTSFLSYMTRVLSVVLIPPIFLSFFFFFKKKKFGKLFVFLLIFSFFYVLFVI